MQLQNLRIAIPLALLGLAIITLSSTLGTLLFNSTLKSRIKSELRLTRGSSTWNKWIEIETPVYSKFYIFNVTNPKEVNSGSALPLFQELGPYVYRQRRTKLNAHSENCKKTVTYQQTTTYYFNQNGSEHRSELDLVNVLNIPFISVMKSVVSNYPIEYARLISLALRTETLVRENVHVGELLFAGFDVSAYNIDPIRGSLPEEFSGFRFGLYKGKNGSSDGVYEVNTGVHDSEDFGKIVKWNGKGYIPYWKRGSRCSRLGGGDGSLFPPFLEKSSVLRLFNSEVCREFELVWDGEGEVKGIKSYKFVIGEGELVGAKDNPANDCYCLSSNVSDCVSGVIDVGGACRGGAPVVLSTPYFLGGDASLGEAVGLGGVADEDSHGTVFEVEPRTGLLLRVHKRLQVNLRVSPVEGVSQLVGVVEAGLFPVVWVDETAEICDVDRDDYVARVQNPIRSARIGMWVGIGVGCGLVVVALVIPFLFHRQTGVVPIS